MAILRYDSAEVYDTWAFTYDGTKTLSFGSPSLAIGDLFHRQPLVEGPATPPLSAGDASLGFVR